MKTLLLVVVLGAFLVAAIVFAVRFGGWGQPSDSIHMWIALGIGVIVSLLLGGGLMALSFHSHAKGYDDAAAGDD